MFQELKAERGVVRGDRFHQEMPLRVLGVGP